MKRSLRFLLPILALLFTSPAFAKLRALPDSPPPTAGRVLGGYAAITGDLDIPESPEVTLWGPKGARGGPLTPIMVSDGVLFRLRDREAETVGLVGEFNDWDETANPLEKRRNGLWKTVVPLEAGDWSYLYVVDGEWVLDPDNPLTEPAAFEGDEEVGHTSLIVVKRDEVVFPRPRGYREGDFSLGGGYQRVDQVYLVPQLSYRNDAELHPRLDFGVGYSFGRKRWLYDLKIVQPFFDQNVLDVGAAAYRITATPDEHRFSNTENTLTSFFAKQDWRDYHEAEGVSAHVTGYFGRNLKLTSRWRGEDHRALEKTTDWSLFGSGDMRENPPADDGYLSALTVELIADTRNHEDHPTRGLLGNASWEWVGDVFGGDFHYEKGVLDLRRYHKLTRGYHFDVRLVGGLMRQASRSTMGLDLSGFEAIPFQERFFLGGLGTMRATGFKSLTGDRMFLGNAEVRVEVLRDLQVVVFADVGDAWIDDTGKMKLKTDAGIGLQDSDASFRINLARQMDRERGGGVTLSGRIQRMF